MGGSRGGGGGQGVWTPSPGKSQKYRVSIGFLSKTGPDPLKKKNTKLPNQHLIQFWAIIGTLIVVFVWILSPLKKEEKTKKRCQSWTPYGKNFWTAHENYKMRGGFFLFLIKCKGHFCSTGFGTKKHRRQETRGLQHFVTHLVKVYTQLLKDNWMLLRPAKMHLHLTICLLMSSTDTLCKHFVNQAHQNVWPGLDLNCSGNWLCS